MLGRYIPKTATSPATFDGRPVYDPQAAIRALVEASWNRRLQEQGTPLTATLARQRNFDVEQALKTNALAQRGIAASLWSNIQPRFGGAPMDRQTFFRYMGLGT